MISKNNLLRNVIWLSALLNVTDTSAAESDKNKYCDLLHIPKKAARLPTHGVDLYIFPNADVVDRTYSGCQNIWLENGFLMAKAKYTRGVIQSFNGQEPNGDGKFECIYRDGTLISFKPDLNSCPTVDYFPVDKEGIAKVPTT